MPLEQKGKAHEVERQYASKISYTLRVTRRMPIEMLNYDRSLSLNGTSLLCVRALSPNWHHTNRARETDQLTYNLVEALGLEGDEVVIEHRARRGVFGRKHAFHQPRQHRDVAARLDLVIALGDLRRLTGHHLHRVLRVDEFHQTPLAQRVEGHDPTAAFDRRLQLVQEARAVGAGVLPEKLITQCQCQLLGDFLTSNVFTREPSSFA